MKKHPKLFPLLTLLALIFFCPTSSRADTAAHAIWGVGVQLGWTEVGANQGVSPDTLVQSLTYARDMARQTSCIPPDELERLRAAMSQARDSRTLYQRITTYRQSLPPYLQRCSCAGGGNAAWALWGLGVQIGWAEMASYLGVPANYVRQALVLARDHARQLNCVNTRPIEDLIAAISRAGDSRALYQRITSYRQGQLLAEVQRDCNCGGARGCNISGTWRHTTGGVGSATWTFTPRGDGRYDAQEQGLGNARGTAALVGNRLRVDWVTGGLTGIYEWQMDSNCASGSGTLAFTRGRNSTHHSSLQRLR